MARPRVRWLAVPDFLPEAAAKTRRRIIECFRAQHGKRNVALLGFEHVLKMLPEIAKLPAKRHWLSAVRGLLRFAVPMVLRTAPTEGVAGIKLPESKVHHTWTDSEIARYLAY